MPRDLRMLAAPRHGPHRSRHDGLALRHHVRDRRRAMSYSDLAAVALPLQIMLAAFAILLADLVLPEAARRYLGPCACGLVLSMFLETFINAPPGISAFHGAWQG